MAKAAALFDSHFEVFLADDELSKRIHYHLRYQIYCLKTGYEDPSNFPDKLERDSYDDQAVHFIVRSHVTGNWVAAMRLVIGPLSRLPVERFATLDRGVLTRLAPDLNARTSYCAEVSRLCVASQLRRRSQEKLTPYQIPWNVQDNALSFRPLLQSEERRKAPWLVLGLLRAALDYSVEHGIEYWFFLTASSLARIMQAQGFNLQTVGPECSHRGKRQPYMRNIDAGIEDLADQSPDVYAMMRRSPAYRLFSELDESRDFRIAANQ